MVQQVMPRRNELIDPAIANVDAALMVFSLAEPPFEAANATRFLVSAEAAAVPVRVLLNKADLLSPEQLNAVMEQVRPCIQLGNPSLYYFCTLPRLCHACITRIGCGTCRGPM